MTVAESPFGIAQQQLRNVAAVFGLDDDMVAILGECKKSVEVSIPTKMDDGSGGKSLRAGLGEVCTRCVTRS